MKNTIGHSVCLTIFGESHGAATGAVLDGMAPGIEVSEEYIKEQLALRAPFGKISTTRHETDEFEILSGVFGGKTTGTPITIMIRNSGAHSADYSETRFIPRPGHADYTAFEKYHGFEDYRGGGHFSGRLTAALTAAGAICRTALKSRGIELGTHLKRCARISDRDFKDLEADIKKLSALPFPVLNDGTAEKMKAAATAAAQEGDSVGGVLETAVINFPAGVGEPFFDSAESRLSHILFSIPAVKGVQFGDGFALSDMRGSLSNDAFYADENGRIKTKSNHNGGINGGITNGMPIIFSCAVKPTPSIYLPQESVDLKSGKNTTLTVKGRHDPLIAHRAAAAVNAAVSLTLCDLLAERFGTDYFAG